MALLIDLQNLQLYNLVSSKVIHVQLQELLDSIEEWDLSPEEVEDIIINNF